MRVYTFHSRMTAVGATAAISAAVAAVATPDVQVQIEDRKLKLSVGWQQSCAVMSNSMQVGTQLC